MTEVADSGVTTPAEALLDPFSFLPGISSRIAGLGGGAVGNDPSYAFHTPYVEAAPGPCNFTVRFGGLAAKYGTLQLRVHMILLQPGAAGSMANMDRIALNRLVQNGGEVSIRFEGFRGYAFALMGLIPGDTDARAEGLVVALDRPASSDSGEISGDGRPTAYGRDTAKAAAELLATGPARFAAPATQICTRPQLLEPAFREWRERLARPDADDLTIWREAFVLQALRRYGMLTAGARGLGLGMRRRALPATLASFGTKVELVGSDYEASPAESDNGIVEHGLAFDPFPKALIDYDFAFSTGALGRAGSLEERMRLFEQSMSCLRAGGLMVHAAPFDLGPEMTRERAGSGAFGRGDVERMALVAISHNHEVAQIRIDRAEAVLDSTRSGQIGAFGIIIRRAASTL